MRTGALDQARDLIDAHDDMTEGALVLCLAKADLHRMREEWASEFLALHRAWEADPGRWQTLVQLLWYGRKVGNDQILRWALDELCARFPERGQELIREKDWIRALAS
jgi:hypothetical protein